MEVLLIEAMEPVCKEDFAKLNAAICAKVGKYEVRAFRCAGRLACRQPRHTVAAALPRRGRGAPTAWQRAAPQCAPHRAPARCRAALTPRPLLSGRTPRSTSKRCRTCPATCASVSRRDRAVWLAAPAPHGAPRPPSDRPRLSRGLAFRPLRPPCLPQNVGGHWGVVLIRARGHCRAPQPCRSMTSAR